MQIKGNRDFYEFFRQAFLNFKIGRWSVRELTTNVEQLQSHYWKLFSEIDAGLLSHVQTAINFATDYEKNPTEALAKLDDAYHFFGLDKISITVAQWQSLHDELVWLENDDRLLLDIDIGLRQYQIQVYEATLGKLGKADNYWPLVAFRSRFDQGNKELEVESIADQLQHLDENSADERERLTTKMETLQQSVRWENLSARLQVLTLLEEFYQGRQTPYGHELVVINYDFTNGMIINAGGDTYCQMSMTDQAKHFAPCRQEFIDFGEFLKRKILHC